MIEVTEVVYADILIVVNTYVNYALLRLTGILCRKKVTLWRVAVASLIGSFYSFIILADFIPSWITALTRLAFAAFIIIISFKISGKKDFFRLFGIFFALNFVFAGLMFAVWLIFSPEKMFFNNGIVYFDINTLTLALMTVACYFIVKLIHKFAAFKAPVNTLYEIEFKCMDRNFCCKAFLDTGNSLKEPFSSFPVIVADENLVCRESDKMTLKMLSDINQDNFRLIPCSAIGSKSALRSYRAQAVHIKGINIDFKSDEIYIAITDGKINGGDFGVLLGPAVFENKTKETEEDYV